MKCWVSWLGFRLRACIGVSCICMPYKRQIWYKLKVIVFNSMFMRQKVELKNDHEILYFCDNHIISRKKMPTCCVIITTQLDPCLMLLLYSIHIPYITIYSTYISQKCLCHIHQSQVTGYRDTKSTTSYWIAIVGY